MEVDKFEHSLDRFIAGRKKEYPLNEWKEVAAELIRNRDSPGTIERLKQIRDKVFRCWKIENGLDNPDPPPLINRELLGRVNESRDEKGNFSWQLAVSAITEMIHFSAPVETSEFLYYDPEDGTWKTGAEEVIAKVLKDAVGTEATRYMRDEITSQIKDSVYVFTEFTQKEGLYINCQNGVLEVETLKLLPHDPDYRFRYVLPVRFDPWAVPKNIFAFLEDIAADDINKAIRVLEMYAYALVPGYPIQKITTLMGDGNNGKSVTLGVLTRFIGKRNIASIPLQTLASSRFATSELRNKLANIGGDVSGGKLQDTSKLKELTGGDYTSGEIKMVQKRPMFVNWAKMIFGFNQLPESPDQTKAFFRRFEMIVFTQDFTGRENNHLIEELTTPEELSGLLNILAMVFVPALLKRGKFHEPMTLEEIRAQYNLSANPALAFIQAHVSANPDSQIPITELYNLFTSWARKKGLNIAPVESFGYTLRNLSGLMVSTRRIQENGVRKDYYVGVRYVETIDVKTDENKMSDNVSQSDRLIDPDYCIYHAIIKYINVYYTGELDKYAIGGIAFLNLMHEWSLYTSIFSTRYNTLKTRSHSCYRVQKPMTPMPPMASKFGKVSDNVIQIIVMDDIDVAWFDRDWHFHAQDLAHVPTELGEHLLNRGIARKVNIGRE